jgi:hypothetical protein
MIARLTAGALLLAAVALSGCGGDGGGRERALGDGGDANTATEKSFEDAMVEYAACMREHGVDMPDPQFETSGDGGNAVTFGVPAGAAPGAGGPDDTAFKDAAEACAPILESVKREMPKLSPEEEAKMRDNALAFAQCMREHGIDMPDPQFESGGSGPMIIQGGGNDEQRTPFDADKFNEAASACEGEGFGGSFRVASGDSDGAGAVGGIRINSASGASK